ncbi:MAG: thiamine ABC transporter substrate-binding protein [Nitriliruptoraceae bacterium]
MTRPTLPRTAARRRRHRTAVWFAVLLAVVLALIGCADVEPDAGPDPAPDDPDTRSEQAAGPTVVTLLTHDSFDVSTEVLEGFTAETGIEVAVVPLGDAGTALNQTILTRDAPQGDLLFGVDTTFLSRALDAELFLPYDSPALADVDAAYLLDPERRALPVTVGDVCLNHDVAWFEQEGLVVPTDLADLADPAYAGLLAVQNPATSSPGLAFLLATIDRFGEDGYLAFWEQLVANDVVVTDGWSEAYYDEFSATGTGDRPLVVSYASSPPAEVYFADPTPETAPTGVIEASCFRQVEFVGILAGTEQEAAARQVVDLLLSRPFQEDLPLRMFVFPVHEAAELPEVFVEHAVLPADPLELDPATIGANRQAWIEAWTATVLR